MAFGPTGILQTVRPQLVLPNETVVPNGLVIHYPFTFTSQLGTTGQQDQGSYAYDGTYLSGTKPFVSSDDVFTATRFTDSQSGVLIPSAALVTGSGPRTICTWIKMLNFNNFHVPLFYGGTVTNNTRFLFYVDKTSHLLTFDPIGVTITQAGALSTNTWYHIGFVLTTATTGFFWNNSVQGAASTFNLNTSAPGTHGINTDDGVTTIYGDTLYYDWRFYNRALTPAELYEIEISNPTRFGGFPYGLAESAMLPPVSAGGGATPRSRGYII